MPPRPEPAALPRRAQLERAWLFWMALLLGGFLAVYAPLQFGRMAAGRRDAGEAASAVAMAGLALLTLFTGTRWCVLLVLALARVNRAEPLQGAGAGGRRGAALRLDPDAGVCGEECIEAALGSLLALDYPAYEIVMVDDGSPDRTLELARPFAGPHRTAHGSCELRVFTKPNGGKWSAHNFGLQARPWRALILCIDADSRRDPLSLRRLVRRLDNPQVAAVAGQIRVRNREGLLTRLQALEYVIANGTYRLAQSATGTVMVVPGPIGLFRRDVLDEVNAALPAAARHARCSRRELGRAVLGCDLRRGLPPLARRADAGLCHRLRAAGGLAHAFARQYSHAAEPALPLEPRHAAGAALVLRRGARRPRGAEHCGWGCGPR